MSDYCTVLHRTAVVRKLQIKGGKFERVQADIQDCHAMNIDKQIPRGGQDSSEGG